MAADSSSQPKATPFVQKVLALRSMPMIRDWADDFSQLGKSPTQILQSASDAELRELALYDAAVSGNDFNHVLDRHQKTREATRSRSAS